MAEDATRSALDLDRPLLRVATGPLTEAATAVVDHRDQRPLAANDFEALAASLGVEAAALEALSEVESSGAGFGPGGRPLLRFEQHLFRRETSRRYDRTHPHLSVPYETSRRLRRNQTLEWRWFDEAFALDPTAAIRSASWGRFQILGSNFERAGFDSPEAMRRAMEAGEREQLAALGAFVESDPTLLRALRQRDWATVARRYNGRLYRQWHYDVRLQRAYERARRRRAPAEPAPGSPDQPGGSGGEPVPVLLP